MALYHKVSQGECLAVLASQYGFTDYHAIWDHAKNAPLQSKRPNPNILLPGDILYIPDKASKEEDRGTGAQHGFAIGGATMTYKTVIKDGQGNPIASAKYTLTVDSQVFTGSTDGSGLLQQDIPLASVGGDLALTDLDVTWSVKFGHLDPFDTPSGAQGRLKCLGYDPGVVDGSQSDTFTAALKAFQTDQSLPVSGTCDDATQAKLKECYGC